MIFYKKGPKPPKKGQPECALQDYEDIVNFFVFPSLQGGLHNHQIAALAMALKQVMTLGFQAYTKQVKTNAIVAGNYLMNQGYNLVTSGTENHLVLWDLRPIGLTGENILSRLKCDLLLNVVQQTRFYRLEKNVVNLIYFILLITLEISQNYVINYFPFAGNKVEKVCDMCNITINKNAVYGDSSALYPGGVHIGK